MKISDCKIESALSCDKNDSVFKVAKILRDKKERYIIVTKDKLPVGIISTTDINNRVVAENKMPKEIKAGEIMTSPILTKDVSDSLAQTYFEMIKANFFSCPVTKNKKFVGIISLKEVTKHLIKDNLKNGIKKN
jgi:CBS domain-containing protein